MDRARDDLNTFSNHHSTHSWSLVMGRLSRFLLEDAAKHAQPAFSESSQVETSPKRTMRGDAERQKKNAPPPQVAFVLRQTVRRQGCFDSMRFKLLRASAGIQANKQRSSSRHEKEWTGEFPSHQQGIRKAKNDDERRAVMFIRVKVQQAIPSKVLGD